MVRQLRRALIGGLAAVALAASGGYAISQIDGAPATIQNVAHLKAKPKLSGLKLAKKKLVGGKKTYGTVTLTSAAPMGGTKVKLAAKSAKYIKVPKSVKVPAGKKTARFAITTAKIARVGTGVVAAGLDGKVLKRKLTLTPGLYLAGLYLDDYSLQGGNATTGTVYLNKAAPAGGVSVALASNSDKATVNAQVKVAAGKKTATFKVNTAAVNAATEVKISAKYGAQTLSKAFVLTKGAAEVVIVPTEFHLHMDALIDSTKQRTLEANIDINAPAPKGGIYLQVTVTRPDLLEMNDGGKVFIPEGQKTGRYYIGYKVVTEVSPFTFSTEYNGKKLTSEQRSLVPAGTPGAW